MSFSLASVTQREGERERNEYALCQSRFMAFTLHFDCALCTLNKHTAVLLSPFLIIDHLHWMHSTDVHFENREAASTAAATVISMPPNQSNQCSFIRMKFFAINFYRKLFSSFYSNNYYYYYYYMNKQPLNSYPCFGGRSMAEICFWISTNFVPTANGNHKMVLFVENVRTLNIHFYVFQNIYRTNIFENLEIIILWDADYCNYTTSCSINSLVLLLALTNPFRMNILYKAGYQWATTRKYFTAFSIGKFHFRIFLYLLQFKLKFIKHH